MYCDCENAFSVFIQRFSNKNTVYSENDDFDEKIGHEFHPFTFDEYIALDKKYTAYEEKLREQTV